MAAHSLRIAQLVKSLPIHRPGGQERHTWDLARGLASVGHRVTVVTSAHPQGEAERHVDGVRIIHLARTPPGRNSWPLFRQIARWVQAFDGEFDIFHAQGFAALLVRPGRTPLLSTVHGTVWSETPLARQVRPLLSPAELAVALWRHRARTLLAPLVHRQWRRSERLICDSEFTRSELTRRWPHWSDRIDVVPLGIELPSEIPQRDQDLEGRPIRLLSVGRIQRVRGLDDLLEALAQVQCPERFRLTIVGEGPHRPALEKRAHRMGLAAQVTFTGHVEEETLDSLRGEADLFVNPEWSQPAFGLVSLEALGWGLPVLGTHTGATPEIVAPDVGWLVPPRRPEKLARNLELVAADPASLARMRGAARGRAQQFSLGSMVQRTVWAYEKVL